jgi:Zn-finger nucleic acid-binding protein
MTTDAWCPKCRGRWSSVNARCPACGVDTLDDGEFRSMVRKENEEFLAEFSVTDDDSLRKSMVLMTEAQYRLAWEILHPGVYYDSYARWQWMRATKDQRAAAKRSSAEMRRGVCTCCGQVLPSKKKPRPPRPRSRE